MRLFFILALLFTGCEKQSNEGTKKTQVVEEDTPSLTFDQKTTYIIETSKWEPYWGENLKNGGPFSEIVTKVFEDMGKKVNIRFIPWARAVKNVKLGKIDFLMGVYYNEERTKFITFNEAGIMNAEEAFMVRANSPITYKTIDDLKSYHFIKERGAVNDPKFDERKDLKVTEVTDFIQGIRMVVKGRADILVTGKLVAIDEINDKAPELRNKIKFLTPSLNSRPLFIGASKAIKGHEEIIERFNISHKKLIDNGTVNAILKKHGF